MNLSCLVFYSLSGNIRHGNSDRVNMFWEWKENCEKCGRWVEGTKGLFCANYGARRGGERLCKRAWCENCYASDPLDRFHINQPQDASGFNRTKDADKNHFKTARKGDHLMCGFQCDTCLFWLLKGRGPSIRIPKDNMLLRCIRRANLDAMWSREPKTVERNRREIERSIKLSTELGIDPKFETLGPYPSDEDVQGISVAVIILKRSLEPGRYADYIQFEAARKLR